MNFEKEIRGDITIENINIERATYREAEEFRKFIQEDIVKGCNKIIINMKPCEFIDSTFLGVLVNSLKQIQKSNGNLKLASIHDDAKILLDITRITEIFTIYPDTEAAIESFTS
jgi:anti-sigma B factor antagonist